MYEQLCTFFSDESDFLFFLVWFCRSRSLCRQKIGCGGTIAAYVAETGQRLYVKDILGVNLLSKFVIVQNKDTFWRDKCKLWCSDLIQTDSAYIMAFSSS